MKPDYTLNLTMKNTGFSSTLIPFEISVMLIDEKTEDYIAIPFDADLRSLESGNKKTFTAKIPVKELNRGDYLIYFSIKDKVSGQTIFLGNKNVAEKNGYLLGRIKK